MRLWRLADPEDHRFAVADRRGRWGPSESGVCPECTVSLQRRVKPLVVEWVPGSDVVGDFTVAGFDSDVMAIESVLDVLADRFPGFEVGPVEMVQDPKLKRSKRSKPRVWLPYEGPPVHELWVTTWVHMDPERSSAQLVRRCGTCSTEFWQLDGVERWTSDYDMKSKRLIRTKSERRSGAGIYVSEADLAGAGIFGVGEFPTRVFCTDHVREFIEEEGFTNVSFLEVGETF